MGPRGDIGQKGAAVSSVLIFLRVKIYLDMLVSAELFLKDLADLSNLRADQRR